LKRSNRLILLIGLFLAVVAFVGVIMLTGNSSSGGGASASPSASPATGHVVKATVDIAAGTTVTASMVELDEVPLAAAGPDTIPDTGLAIGKTIRQSVTKGETLGYSFFVSSGVEANITDGLPRGLRAMAIQVSQVTGVGTLIQNGDHVDVVISMKIQNVIPDPVNKGQVINVGTEQPSVKMILQNVPVVGTLLPPSSGSNAEPSPTPTPSGQTSGGSQGPTTSLNGQSEMVLVAVTANQAEIIRYAQLYADPAAGDNISLVLRSPKDYIKLGPDGNPVLVNGNPVATTPPNDTTDGVILKTLIDKYGVLPPDLLNK
jgi:Flp pilus assembly protein CpaB